MAIKLQPDDNGKYHFHQIAKLTKTPTYRVDVSWEYLLEHLQGWDNNSLFTLNLDPDFQRAHVWTEKQQVAYIEYMLRGGSSGHDIYFNHPNWMGSFRGEMVLVDGKQRVNAVTRFLNNEFAIFNGIYYNQFVGNTPFETGFVVHVNDLKSEADILQWYLEMNGGGTPHTDEELNRVKSMLNSI